MALCSISNSAGLGMGTVVNIAGIGMGLERQHDWMGRAWELDVRGWGGDGSKCSGSGWVWDCNSNPVQNSSD